MEKPKITFAWQIHLYCDSSVADHTPRVLCFKSYHLYPLGQWLHVASDCILGGWSFGNNLITGCSLALFHLPVGNLHDEVLTYTTALKLMLFKVVGVRFLVRTKFKADFSLALNPLQCTGVSIYGWLIPLAAFLLPPPTPMEVGVPLLTDIFVWSPAWAAAHTTCAGSASGGDGPRGTLTPGPGGPWTPVSKLTADETAAVLCGWHREIYKAGKQPQDPEPPENANPLLPGTHAFPEWGANKILPNQKENNA